MNSDNKITPPIWASKMRALTDYLAVDCFGGPKILKFAWVVNLQKAGTFVFLGLLMWYYQNTTIAAWVFLALHGSYGLIWLIKDLAFPDANWQRRVTFMGAINSFLFVLGPYWLFGWLLISGRGADSYPLPNNAWYGLCISICLIGCVLMIAADAQKYFTLKYHKGLITNGMHRYIRHPNYLGEIMIYCSLALMVWHWLPFLILLWVWLSVFAVNIAFKEASMARYPEWAAYKKSSWYLLPFVF